MQQLGGLTIGADGNITALAAFGTDGVIPRADGTGRILQPSGVIIDDSNIVSGMTRLELGTTADPYEAKSLSGLNLCRTIVGGTGGARGYRDASVTSNLGGHCSYAADATLGIAGTEVFTAVTGHGVSFQGRQHFAGLSIPLMTSFWSRPKIHSGTVAVLRHNQVVDAELAGGAITWQIGYYLGGLTSGSVDTALLFEDEFARSYFWGPVVCGTNQAGTTDGVSKFQVEGGSYLNGNVKLQKTITAAATTGAQTIDKTSGSVNFAAAATSLVVTNNLVTANSVIHATVATNDGTMKSVQAVAGAGSFTLYPNAAPGAETRVNFLVTN